MKKYVRQYEPLALEFIQKNQDHRGIQAALAWFDNLLELGASRAPKIIWGASTPWQRALKWFSELRRQDVSSQTLLATTIAMYLLREINPNMFVDTRTVDPQRHFRHQLIHRLLRNAKGVRQKRPHHTSDRWNYPGGTISVGLREMLGHRLMDTVGLVAGRAARHIAETQLGLAQEDFVPGSDDEFNEAVASSDADHLGENEL